MKLIAKLIVPTEITVSIGDKEILMTKEQAKDNMTWIKMCRDLGMCKRSLEVEYGK